VTVASIEKLPTGLTVPVPAVPAPAVPPREGGGKGSKIAIIAAFLFLYLVWGSTYLGIKVAVQEMPPFVVGALRFVSAGLVLLLAAHWSGAQRLSARGLRSAVFVGVLLAGISNGSVVFAQKTIPSGIASLWGATIPVWVLVLNTLFFARAVPPPTAIVGVLLGCIGIGLLPGATFASADQMSVVPMAVLLVGCLAWGFGTLWQRRTAEAGTVLHAAGVQSLAGGLFLAAIALVSGQWQTFTAVPPSVNAWLAVAYLSVLGTALALTAYSWLLTVVEAQKVATYALVTPVVAMTLGTWLGGERLTSSALVAGALVLTAVALILWRR
jgi:drug/metabolite transporter (DMT)-like permease